jgi:predicted O-methyltransferase YrrM
MKLANVPVPLLDKVRGLLESNWREDDWFYCDSRVIFHYAMKAAICEKYSPRRVIEIGTRCGYSLITFAAVAPRASFLCIDGAMDEDSFHCLAHAKRLIERHSIEADLVVVDSHAIKSLPIADFAHVDGDHSYDGALADLRLVRHCRVILADDCDNHDVKRAVEAFAAESGREVEYFDDGLRTAGVIV